MGGSRKSGQPPDEGDVGWLLRAISQRISDGDLPGGIELDPARVALIFGSSRELVALALAKLEDAGVTVRTGESWMVRIDRVVTMVDMLNRVGPLLRAMTSLAASRISPSDAAGLLAAYDQLAGFAGSATSRQRGQGYALYMKRLAAASGSSFHIESTDLVLEKATAAIDAFFAAGPGDPGAPSPGDELAWLARALMAGDTAAADAAIVKHLRLIGEYLAASSLD